MMRETPQMICWAVNKRNDKMTDQLINRERINVYAHDCR